MADQAQEVPLDSEDKILQDELINNRRVVEDPDFGEILLRRPTPRSEARISEIRGRYYHKFLQDDGILSQAQLERIGQNRGIWTTEDEEEYSRLQGQLSEIIGVFSSIGFSGIEELQADFEDTLEDLQNHMDMEMEGVEEALEAYQDFNEERDPQHDRTLFKACVNSTGEDLLEDLQDCRVQIELLYDLIDIQDDWVKLTKRRTLHFGDSLEQRTERAQRLAKIYYCVLDAETAEPLWEDFEDIWDEEPETLARLQDELFAFEHGLTEKDREVFEEFGFGARAITTEDSSEDSHDRPKSNSDGESQEATSEDSSGSDTASK